MAAGGHTDEQGGDHEHRNVIRFPGNWVDKSDLVPFGPAADVPAPDAPPLEVPPLEGPEPLSADDFWGEDAGELHQPVAVPARQPEPVTEPEIVSSPAEAAARPWVARWRLPAAVAGLLLLLAVVLGSGVFTSDQAPSPSHVIRHIAAAPQPSIADELSAAENIVRHTPVPHVTPRRAHHHVSRSTPKAVAVTRAPASTQTVARASDAVSAPVTQRSVVTSNPTSASSSSTSRPETSSSSVSQGSSEPAGPLNPGSAGTNCDPQCT